MDSDEQAQLESLRHLMLTCETSIVKLGVRGCTLALEMSDSTSSPTSRRNLLVFAAAILDVAISGYCLGEDHLGGAAGQLTPELHALCERLDAAWASVEDLD